MSYLLASNIIKKNHMLWNLLWSISGWGQTWAALSKRGIPSRARTSKKRKKKEDKTMKVGADSKPH